MDKELMWRALNQKAELIWIGEEETNESEPLMKCRKTDI